MANLVENAEWVDGIYQLETTDLVEGGPDGVDNIQAIQLAKRTQFLKALILAAQNSLAGHEAASDPHPQYLTTAEGNSMIATAVSALVNSSPATLDTLNELAAALGNDPNFATSIATSLGNKQPLDQTLTALAALVTAADTLIYATGADTFATTKLTELGRLILGCATSSELQLIIPSVPAGIIGHFSMESAPSGWLKANGAAISRTSYASLFSAIGTTFGDGDGATTFNVPDIRGEFIRGFDNGRGIDSGRVIGSFQSDAMQGHKHRMLDPAGGTPQSWGATGGSQFFVDGYGTVANGSNNTGIPVTDGTNGTPRIAKETRPRNAAFLACIKY